jgi:hypothetical protein
MLLFVSWTLICARVAAMLCGPASATLLCSALAWHLFVSRLVQLIM